MRSIVKFFSVLKHVMKRSHIRPYYDLVWFTNPLLAGYRHVARTNGLTYGIMYLADRPKSVDYPSNRWTPASWGLNLESRQEHCNAIDLIWTLNSIDAELRHS